MRPKSIFPSFLLGFIIALILGKLLGLFIAEVVCDNVQFEEEKLAPYSATGTCNNGIVVTLLDQEFIMTLYEWSQLQPYALGYFNREGGRYMPDSINLINRADAWSLSDYRVSSVSGGTIWFSPR